MESWTEAHDRNAGPRQPLTSRAPQWTRQVANYTRSLDEMAGELGSDWHTVIDTVVSSGDALLNPDNERIGEATALGLEEVLMVRIGPWRRQFFSTELVNIFPDRSSAEPMGWLSKDECSGSASSSAPSIAPAPTSRSSRSRCPVPSWLPISCKSPRCVTRRHVSGGG